MMTIDALTFVGAFLVTVGSAGAVILSFSFCVRPAPRQLRIAREVALALVAVQVMAARPFGLALGWGYVAPLLALGALTCAIALWNLRSVMGAGGDRCGS